jgi:hypothetical protein
VSEFVKLNFGESNYSILIRAGDVVEVIGTHLHGTRVRTVSGEYHVKQTVGEVHKALLDAANSKPKDAP